MTSVLTYSDVKRPLTNNNEIQGVANLEASNRNYVLNRRADALVKSVANCVELVPLVMADLDKLSSEKRVQVEAALAVLTAPLVKPDAS